MINGSARKIELWCDSFHEGCWAAEGILQQWSNAKIDRSYHLGFIPHYTVRTNGQSLELVVFGGYGNWTTLPGKIRDLLDWGKPDIVGYDRENDTILFAVEETAAVPTGNQALQRCERMHGAGTMRVPFWYLLSQFGTHVDEGTRQASPWPALMAVALTATFRIPNVVLFYSTEASPEDYAAGQGMAQLFKTLGQISQNFALGRDILSFLGKDLTEHYAAMLRFVGDTYRNVTDFLPHTELLADPSSPARLAAIACQSDKGKTSFPLLDWPLFKDLPDSFSKKQTPASFIKPDQFLAGLEKAKQRHLVYTLSQNAGSRPQPESDLNNWILDQKRLHAKAQPMQPRVDFLLKLKDFPESKSGLRHVSTSTNILYLVDDMQIVFRCLEAAFPRLKGKFNGRRADSAAFVYVSNSVKPGRIFGDPYTGQFAAYSWVFGGSAEGQRVRFAYFPHQSHGVFRPLRTTRNKGQLIFLSRADFLIFHSGAVYSVRDKVWL